MMTKKRIKYQRMLELLKELHNEASGVSPEHIKQQIERLHNAIAYLYAYDL